MIPLRKHPSMTWTAPYVNEYLDETTFTTLDRVDRVEAEGATVKLQSGPTVIRIHVCAPGILRFTLAPDGSMPSDQSFPSSNGDFSIFRSDWPACDFLLETGDSQATLLTARLKVVINYAPFELTVFDIRDSTVLLATRGGMAYRMAEDDYETLSFFDLGADDAFYGFGGRTHRPNRGGSTADMLAIKVWHERGDYGGFPCPYFLNPKGYGFVLNNPRPHVYFDMGRTYPDQWFLHTPGGPLDFYVLAGPELPSIARAYCELTGFPVLPPKWMLGFWVSWVKPAESEQRCVEIAERFRTEGWPMDVFVLDMFWRGGWLNVKHEGEQGRNFGWDTENFGDGTALIPHLHEKDIRLCLHLNTTLFAEETLREGLRKHFLRKEDRSVIVPRLTHKEAEEWYWRFHQPFVEQGVDVWWVDNSERVDGVLETGQPSRNLFGHLWNDFLHKRMARSGHDKRLVMSRSGWIGSQKHVLAWPGDTAPGVDRLQEDLWWQMNCGMSGIVYNTVDLGGFICQELSYENSTNSMHTTENTIRRVIHGILFTTVPRIHGPQKFPWQYSPEVQDLYRFYLELRYRLFPYLYSYFVRGAETGAPVYRPLVWNYQHDRRAREDTSQLMCGDWLLMAPVTREGYLEWEVYLPEGQWIDFWTLREYEGNRTVVVDTPVKERHGLPVFVRKGAVIPMRPMRFHNQDGHERELMLHIFPSESGDQTFYDDRGIAYDVRYCQTGLGMEVSVNNPLGEERIVHVIVHDASAPSLTESDQKGRAFPFESGHIRTVALRTGETATVRVGPRQRG
jgi:alpha-glucosidase (family GH31 glycosyl hydrolase)